MANGKTQNSLAIQILGNFQKKQRKKQKKNKTKEGKKNAQNKNKASCNTITKQKTRNKVITIVTIATTTESPTIIDGTNDEKLNLNKSDCIPFITSSIIFFLKLCYQYVSLFFFSLITSVCRCFCTKCDCVGG